MYKLSENRLPLNFKYLPLFAQYLLDNKLQEFAQVQITFVKEFNLPILKLFQHFSDEQLLQDNIRSSQELLNYLAENRAADQIEAANKKWIENRLKIKREDIVAEDITLIIYLRKKTFVHFIPFYSNNPEEIISLINEIDLFLAQAESQSTQSYINLLRSRIEEQAYLTSKITNTSPGMIYLFNLVTNSISFANERVEEFLGIKAAALIEGEKALSEFIHPDDLPIAIDALSGISHAKDTEIRDVEYRLKNKDGQYLWVRNYISVFKRNEDNEPVEAIGNVLDIHTEKLTAEQLKQREDQLTEAQEVAQMGNFDWDLKAKKGILSDELLRILEIPTPLSIDAFLSRVHPEDKEAVIKAYTDAINQTGFYEIEYRYAGKQYEKTIWSRAKVTGEDGSLKISGIAMDVTSRAAILEQLRKSKEQYKQAQALSHIGHFTLDYKTKTIFLTDELKRIFGIDPEKTDIKYDEITSLRHPDDKTNVQREIQQAIINRDSFDFYYRIVLKDGTQKTLHALGKCSYNENGETDQIVGAVQDVTAYQNLVQKLQRNESLYKQAEVLANMGNWSWNTTTNKLEWSDQLYKIYGLQPQSEEITLDRFLSFIHPEDRPVVEKSINEEYKENVIDYTFRIITADGSEKTIRSIAQAERNEHGKLISIIGSEQDITEHQNLIQQLKQSEELYKQAQALAHVGNWSWNIKEDLVLWSDELYKIYGLAPQSELITFETYHSFTHPNDRNIIAEQIQKSIETGEPWNTIHRIIRRDGSLRYISGAGEALKDSQGKVYKMLGSAQDITQQKEYEKQLSEQQNFIQKIADATPSIIAAYNIHTGKYVFINQGLRKLLGYDPEEVLQNNVSFFNELIHLDDIEQLINKNAQAIQEFNKPQYQSTNDVIVDFEYRMKHKNGDWRWFHTYGTIFDRNSKGEIEHVLNISLDITERIEAEKKLAEQEHFIKHIADASPTILYLFDAGKNNIIYINREIFFVLGYSPEEIIEMDALVNEQLYHPEDFQLLPERKGSSKHFQQQDSMIQYECRMRHKNGEWLWVLVREIAFKTDEHGNVLQVLGAALDINRRKEMERSLLNNSFQLEQSNASLEEFAYVASHDLKEPLRKISTFGERLVATQSNNLTEDGKIYLRKIIDASQRMQTMINDLLSISMISGNKAYEPYSLQTILGDVLQTLEYKLEQKNAIINADPLPDANIIPSQFRQLFQNLLSNSLKFTRENVQPVIQITHQYIKAENVKDYQLSNAGKYHKIEFIDNGIGFENEFSGKIFAIFQRLHGRSEYEGTGIGLAICKKIVEHHGGIIYAYGVPDQGATFTIILPA